jgi:branched-chain amino acid transport system substrate-binding protein
MTAKINTNRQILFIAILMILLALGGCTKADSPGKPQPAPPQAPQAAPPAPAGPSPTQGVTDTQILIGTWSPQTGPGSSWGGISRGVKAYFDWINDQGGIHGRKLKLVIRDDGYMPPRTVAVVKEMAESQKVFAFVSGVGTATGMAVKDVLDEKQIINFAPASGSSAWTNPMSSHRFAVYPNYATEAKLLVKYASETLGKKKIAMFYQNDAFGKEGLTGAQEGCKEFGAELISKVSYELTDADLSTQALKIKASGADTVIIWSTAKHAAAFIKEAAKIAYAPQFLATSTLSDPIMFKLAGDSWNGLIIANWMPMIDGDSDGAKHYREAMKKFAPKERLGNFTLIGFMFGEPLTEGLRRAGKDLTTDALITALESIKGFNGEFVHNLSFSPDDHQGMKSIYFIKAEGGKLKKISDWL